MKHTACSLLAIATTVFAFSSAHAQDAARSMYAEIGYTQFNVKGTDGTDTRKFSPRVASGIFGYQATPVMAVEGLVGLGLGARETQFNGVNSGVDGKVKSVLGFFVRPSVAVTDRISLFARVGMVRTTLTLSAGGNAESYTGSDIAYGVGANFNIADTSYIQTSAMSYYQKNGFKLNGLTVAYGMRF